MKNRIHHQRTDSWFPLETLESRLTLAADGITASVHGGHLMIKGGKSDAIIILDDTLLQAGQVRVSTGDSGIKINHQSGDVVLGGVTRDIKVILGKGDDTVIFNGLSAPHDISIIGGSGDDSVTLNDVDVAGTVSFIGASGDDAFTFNSGSVGKDIKLVTGPDSDRVAITEWDPLESTCRHASLSIL